MIAVAWLNGVEVFAVGGLGVVTLLRMHAADLRRQKAGPTLGGTR